MNLKLPTATYRVQLRDGIGFAQVRDRLDHIAGLGVSHLYLSPIFTATTGSTHGYDITDPTQIDPVLGGAAGFRALAQAAKGRGLGIILDIVPNHTAFTLENPWLRDVLRQGRASRHAAAFDIDWDAGPLVLPFLPEPFEKLLAEGAFAVGDGCWQFGDLHLPLADADAATDDLRALHDAQHWRLVHSDLERDGITHRRFFNVTSLIGMRVEDPAVFDATHALILDLVRDGLVQGLRVDHIDGLADPAAYLARLRRALPDTPVWVEKILVGDEALPDWDCIGTTGYEHARLIARLLTDAAGLQRLDPIWRQATGVLDSFRDVLRQSKLDVLEHELAAERRQLRDMAALAAQGSALAEPGPESLREAVTALLVAMPRYRSYPGDGPGGVKPDILAQIADQAAQGLRSRTVLDLVVSLMQAPPNDAARALACRFQQVSGALLAKAQEDTAGFRWTRYLAANEVGAEPDEATVTQAQANAAVARARPGDMVSVSTHDTKRSGDARMRLAAISHLPEAFGALDAAARTLPTARQLDPRWRWYAVQSALALWQGDADAVAPRLTAHLEKAMREAKLTSFWSNPDQVAETAAADFLGQLLAQWAADPPPALAQLLTRGAALILAQRAFQMLLPGFPDLYRGDEAPFPALTDPDNRLPVDWDALAMADDPKASWTRALLKLRAQHAGFLTNAAARIKASPAGVQLLRQDRGQVLIAEISYDQSVATDGGVMLHREFSDGVQVRVCAQGDNF